MEHLLDQHPPEAGTVDKQIARQRLPVLQLQRLDIAGFGILRNVDNPALHADCTALLGKTPQEGGIEAGVELECVIDGRHRPGAGLAVRAHETLRPGGLGLGTEIAVVEAAARTLPAQPVMDEANSVHIYAEHAEWMKVAMARAAPVYKLDPELERRVRFAHELVFVQAQHAVVELDHRDRGLADSDGADLLGLDEGDAVALGAQYLGERCRSHPARRASAN